jgi:Subtilase family
MRSRLAAAAALLGLAAAVRVGGRANDPTVPAGPLASDSIAVWVFFEPDSARSTLPAPIGKETRAARRNHHISDFDNDRPLPRALLRRVAFTGARIREQSRWLRAVSVWADHETLRRLEAIPAVAAVRRVGIIEPAGNWDDSTVIDASVVADRASDRAAAVRQALDSTYYGPNWPILRQLGIPQAHVLTFTGKIIIAILDTGFDPRHESLRTRQVIGKRDFINGDTIVYNDSNDPAGVNQARHGTQVWSLVGGFKPGTLVGPAHDALFLLAKVKSEVNNSRADEDRWVAAVEWADSAAAKLIVSALTFRYDFTDRADIQYGELNGDSTLTTRIADEAARRGILVVTAVGDNGPSAGSLGAPADADSVVAVGAVDANGDPAAGSFGATARGPTVDGRTKPEAVARGTSLFAASALSTSAYDIGLSGTSYPTALVAGGAAALMEAWGNLSAAAIRRALILSASHAGHPDNATGYGVPDIASAILFPAGLLPSNVATVDLTNTLTTLAPEFNFPVSLVHPSLRPVRYRLEIARDSTFNDIIYRDSVSEAFKIVVTRPLHPAAKLWWRVVARAALGITRTSPASVPFTVPSWVRLLTPDPTQATFVNQTRPELAWAPLAAPAPIGPLVYDVEVLSNLTGLPVQPAQRNLTTSTIRVAEPLVPNTAYRWRVVARTRLGDADTVESTNPFVVTSDTAPPATLLYQNFPNPFPNLEAGRSGTQIWFDIADTATVELTVHDQRGRLIRRLIPAEASCGTVTLEPGIYGRAGPLEPNDPCVATSWDGRDASGRTVARGIYLLRLRANGRDFFKNMVFLPER